MKFAFTDKTSYLKWRQEWKDNYARLSTEIRTQKRGRKQYLRTYQTTETPQGKMRQLVSKTDNPRFGRFNPSQLARLRREAKGELEMLIEAKDLSYALKCAALGHDPTPREAQGQDPVSPRLAKGQSSPKGRQAAD